ncbi:MAG: DUF5915 domain-containing protein [Eubacteriales bacterium]
MRRKTLVSTGKTDGFVAATDNETIVVLDTKLTQELIDEGFVRELISKVQTMRKEAGFEVSDHIALSYDGSAKIEEIFSRFGDEILSETLGETLDKRRQWLHEGVGRQQRSRHARCGKTVNKKEDGIPSSFRIL